MANRSHIQIRSFALEGNKSVVREDQHARWREHVSSILSAVLLLLVWPDAG